MSSSSIESAKKKEKPANVVIPPPKPKLSKAERRAMQEQQRADKAARGGAKRTTQQELETNQNKLEKLTISSTAKSAEISGAAATTTTPLSATHADKHHASSVSLVSHLPPYHDPASVFRLIGPTLQVLPHVTASFTAGASSASAASPSASSSNPTSSISTTATLHPAILQLGLDYATLKIRGGNARCRAMLHCFRTLLNDYQLQSTNGSTKTIDVRQAILHDVLNPAFSFWTHYCRPHSVSMGNAFTSIKHVVASLDRTGASSSSDWNEQRNVLLQHLHEYERERMEFAGIAICDVAMPLLTKQQGEQVILTIGYSEAVAKILLRLAQRREALQGGDDEFSVRVIIVDSRPNHGGKKLLRKLVQAGMPCTYILVNALSYVLQDVTKVLLGASALMSDGSVLGQVGTGCVALAAHMQHIPVLVCCETYKISNKLYLESITHNELGDPNALNIELHGDDRADMASNDSAVKKLHLMYDLTPASFVSGIVTELGIVPASSVAVLLREMTPQEFKYEN
ncbi:hypothetical protein MPSEU_001086300 [Mayamaea pseudoterrestris]|nr:hypothetical protein MPSEU_001086300 [Mayamaea pseudoterrestris]